MFSNSPAASAQFLRKYVDKVGRPLSPEFQRAAENYDYYNQQFLPHQYDTIAKGTAGPGGAKFGEYGYNSVAASKKIANTPGAGLWAVGIDPNSPDADRQAQAFIDNNTNRGYEGLRMTSGNWGRADAELPNLLKMQQANPDLTAKQLLDYQLRGGHMQSALPPRTTDIGDILVPAAEIALGFLGGPTWGPVLGAGLGGGYGLANNGLMGGILGAAGGYGGAGFGADVAAKGVGGALANQVSGITGLLKPGGLSSGVSSAFTPANIGSTAVNALGSVPQSWATPSTSAANNILPLAAFGTQAAGALKPTPAKPVTPITPSSVKLATPTLVKPVTPPTTNPFNINPAAIRQKLGGGAMNTVKKAGGGMLPTSKTEMNPMGGAPVSTYGLASFAPQYQAAKGGYLDGPGDGMSDSIHATIEGKQPARLADGEFVIPADVVSGLGNGSSKAGAKVLYAMMDKIRHARTGTKKQGKQIDPNKFLPA